MPVTSAVQGATGRYVRPFFVETRMSNEEAEIIEQQDAEPVEAPEVVAAEQDSEQADTEGEAAAPSGEDATAKPKKGIQERINELTRQRHDEKRAAEEARAEAEYWKSQAIQKEPESQAPQPTGKPQVDQYDSYEDYLEALSDYKVEQRLSQGAEERQRQEQEQHFAAQRDAFHKRAEKLEVDDFVEVVYNPSLTISEEMQRLAFESDKGPEILYHLGKNPAEAARIAVMSPAQAGRAIGMLEASLTLPPAKHVSSAPPPITPITGGGEPPKVDPDKMTPDQWRDWRNEQLRQKGQR